MKQRNNPAFPVIEGHMHSFGAQSQNAGLTKREIFAMAALQGLCGIEKLKMFQHQDIAELAVLRADALIKALEE